MTWRLDANSASGNTRAHTDNVFVRWMLSTCVFKSAALAPSLALTQQPLSILFYFVTLDFQSPRAPESLQTPVNSSYKSSRGQMDGGKIMEELSVCLCVCVSVLPWWRCWRSESRVVCALCHPGRWNMKRRAGAEPPLLGWRWPSSGPACSWPCTWWALPHLNTHTHTHIQSNMFRLLIICCSSHANTKNISLTMPGHFKKSRN